jgi:hypothetical protein
VSPFASEPSIFTNESKGQKTEKETKNPTLKTSEFKIILKVVADWLVGDRLPIGHRE